MTIYVNAFQLGFKAGEVLFAMEIIHHFEVVYSPLICEFPSTLICVLSFCIGDEVGIEW